MGLLGRLFGCSPKKEEPEKIRLEQWDATIIKVESFLGKALVTLKLTHENESLEKQAVYDDNRSTWYWYPSYNEVSSKSFIFTGYSSIPFTPQYYKVLEAFVNRMNIEGLTSLENSYLDATLRN